MFKRIQKGLDKLTAGKLATKCQVNIQVQTLHNIPASVKQVRVVWARSGGKGVKASTHSCVVHSGNTLDSHNELLAKRECWSL